MLGHELRNPLATLSSASELLKIGKTQPAVIDNVQNILGRQVRHMTHLVDDLLEVGRVTGGKIRLQRETLDLAQVAGHMVATWRDAGRFADHAVSATLEAAWVSADRARIEQIVSNLLDNALKYTPAGGQVHVHVRREGSNAVLEMTDTGEGMPPELVERVFDLFVQGQRGLAREQGGLGIGLTMVKRLAELHDGEIRARSAGPGQGAAFIVTLPAIEIDSLPAAVAPTAAPAARPRRILVIEDNRDNRESLTALLRLHGHDVQCAENGRDGLATATVMKPDLALIDIGLPDMDGYEVVRQMKDKPGMCGIRVIALTGYGTHQDRRRAFNAGFDEHLSKPVEMSALEALMQSVLK
jgi:two-component system, sensor histidine kinase